MTLLIYLIVLLIVCGGLAYIVNLMPLEQTWKTIAQVLILLIFVIILLTQVLMPLIGGGPVILR